MWASADILYPPPSDSNYSFLDLIDHISNNYWYDKIFYKPLEKIIAWTIWSQRNNVTLDSNLSSCLHSSIGYRVLRSTIQYNFIANNFLQDVSTTQHQRDTSNRHTKLNWIPSPLGWYKRNVDARLDSKCSATFSYNWQNNT